MGEFVNKLNIEADVDDNDTINIGVDVTVTLILRAFTNEGGNFILPHSVVGHEGCREILYVCQWIKQRQNVRDKENTLYTTDTGLTQRREDTGIIETKMRVTQQSNREVPN